MYVLLKQEGSRRQQTSRVCWGVYTCTRQTPPNRSNIKSPGWVSYDKATPLETGNRKQGGEGCKPRPRSCSVPSSNFKVILHTFCILTLPILKTKTKTSIELYVPNPSQCAFEPTLEKTRQVTFSHCRQILPPSMTSLPSTSTLPPSLTLLFSITHLPPPPVPPSSSCV